MFARFTQLGHERDSRSQSERESEKWDKLQRWYQTSLGHRLYRAEKKALNRYLPDLFGYFLLQPGCPEIRTENKPMSWLSSSRISNRFRFDLNQYPGITCQSISAQLPVLSDSVDLVVLPHVLEFSETPHQVLREVERALIPEGHVVIMGFNPYSLWNLVRLLVFWRRSEIAWNTSYLSASRVIDWLALLGFDVIKREGYVYSLPIQNKSITRKLRFLEQVGRRFWPHMGAGYLLVAKKRVETLTPIRPKWRSKRRVMRPGLETANRDKF